MKLITDRDILQARAALMREIEAGKAQCAQPLSDEEVNREIKQRKKIGARIRYKKWAAENPGNPLLPGEIKLKQYIDERAAKEGIPRNTLVQKLFRSNYEGVPIRRVNQRVIFVQMNQQTEI